MQIWEVYKSEGQLSLELVFFLCCKKINKNKTKNPDRSDKPKECTHPIGDILCSRFTDWNSNVGGLETMPAASWRMQGRAMYIFEADMVSQNRSFFLITSYVAGKLVRFESRGRNGE